MYLDELKNIIQKHPYSCTRRVGLDAKHLVSVLYLTHFGREIIIRIPDFGGYELFLCQQRETHSKILRLKSTNALNSLF